MNNPESNPERVPKIICTGMVGMIFRFELENMENKEIMIKIAPRSLSRKVLSEIINKRMPIWVVMIALINGIIEIFQLIFLAFRSVINKVNGTIDKMIITELVSMGSEKVINESATIENPKPAEV